MDLSSPVISKTGEQCITASYWQCDITLDYSTPYYWRVRATAASGCGAWSEKGVFVTLAEPAAVPVNTAPLPPTPPTLPSPCVTEPLPQTSQTVKTTTPAPVTDSPPPAAQTAGNTPAWMGYAAAGAGAAAVLLTAVLLLANRQKGRLL